MDSRSDTAPLACAPSATDVARLKALRDARVRALLAGRTAAPGGPGAGAAGEGVARPTPADRP